MALVENRKARFDYEILEQFEAGIALSGSEVKSLRKGQASLEGSFVSLRDNIPALVGMYISPYQPGNQSSALDPRRERKLLLSRKEIATLIGKSHSVGQTIIPLSLYTKGRRIKVSIALVRGKKTRDKRETIKKREANKEIARMIKRSR